MPENRDSEARTADGRFAKGVSGNPGGRSRRLREVQDAIDASLTPTMVVETLEKLRELGMAGNVAALRLWLDRVVGPARTEADDLFADLDFKSAPDDVVNWLAEQLGAAR